MRATNEPAPAAAEGPELRPGLGLAVGPLPEPCPVGQRGLHVHPVEAPRHHGQQQYHGGQETREPERVVAQGLGGGKGRITQMYAEDILVVNYSFFGTS